MIEKNWPKFKYGYAIGLAPNQPKNKETTTKNQNNIALKGLKSKERTDGRTTKGKTKKTNILANKARTPKSLLGIERNIA